MYSHIKTWVNLHGLAGLADAAPIVAYVASLAIGLVICVFSRKVVYRLLMRFVTKTTAKDGRRLSNWANVLTKNKFFSHLSNLTFPVIASIIAADIGLHSVFWGRAIAVMLVVISVLLTDSFIRSIGDIYNSYEVSKSVPLRGMLQVLEIAVFVVGAIILVSIFVDRNPSALLGGIGAMTAIITIVFKDAILGFTAGIQLSANDMVRVGDMIDFPKRDIIGTVTDISLITVKIEALDKTIIAIPAYTFISEPFVNRRNMIKAGARLIRRSFHIDANTVCECSHEMITPLKNMPLISENIQIGMPNIGIFREYIIAYLKNHPDINQEQMLLVRQLHAADIGIPLEVYAFANATQLVPFENIQSSIFDHIYTVMPKFGLKLYQSPTGGDIQAIVK